jgi:uncharacterized ParB-like nuclease family protein
VSNSAADRNQEISMGIFNAARRRAFFESVLSEMTGRPGTLLSFDQVREQLHLGESDRSPDLREIPLNKIVGSVGRYRDFSRAFLPRAHVDSSRWTHIEQMLNKRDLPPIDVLQVGDVYFVQDGNHRVSVARSRKAKTIWAHVIEIPTRVSIDATTSPEDMILKAGYTDFLEKTLLDQTCPEQHIELTRPGAYHSLLQHIEVHQFYMGLRSRRYPTLPEAAQNWYEQVYMPVVTNIRASNVLERFPARTEADLYLWIAENRASLQILYGAQSETRNAVDAFARSHRVPPLRRWVQRTLHRIFPRFRPPEPKAPPSKRQTGDP